MWSLTKTLFELLTFWFVVLIAIPIGISILEVALGVQRFPGFPVLSALVLVVFSLLGLWSALALAIAGRGTLLAVDGPTQLVTSGPYAYVRNPFTIALVGQATAIVLALGSYPVMIYFIALIAWIYFYARPREERRLRERFGERWTDYERQVRAYRPRLTPYVEKGEKGV